MQNVCEITMRKLNFHLPKGQLLTTESYTFRLQKLPFFESFLLFFEGKSARFA